MRRLEENVSNSATSVCSMVSARAIENLVHAERLWQQFIKTQDILVRSTLGIHIQPIQLLRYIQVPYPASWAATGWHASKRCFPFVSYFTRTCGAAKCTDPNGAFHAGLFAVDNTHFLHVSRAKCRNNPPKRRTLLAKIWAQKHGVRLLLGYESFLGWIRLPTFLHIQPSQARAEFSHMAAFNARWTRIMGAGNKEQLLLLLSALFWHDKQQQTEESSTFGWVAF